MDCFLRYADLTTATGVSDSMVLPGALRYGGMKAFACLDAPDPLFLYNYGTAVDTGWLEDAYRIQKSKALRLQPGRATQEALAAWLELAQRNPADRSVLDGLLAIPYAYADLGGYEQSVKHYQIALETIQAQIKHVETAIEQVRVGGMLNVIVDNISQARSEAFNEYQNFPIGPESIYLAGLYETHAFQTALRNYRDLRLMELQLQRWAGAIYSMENTSDTFKKVYVDQIAAKQTKLAAAAAEMKQYIGKLALTELENRRARLRGYTADALFKLGQMYDRDGRR